MKRTLNEKRGGGGEELEINKLEPYSVLSGNMRGGYEKKGWRRNRVKSRSG